ncbi:MAG TPA: hypothetical protein VGR87_06075 [Candidatus Limnocylindria bacterium]|nr:hypothetical protein [Candidatus Limnocylindria bacterium]
MAKASLSVDTNLFGLSFHELASIAEQSGRTRIDLFEGRSWSVEHRISGRVEKSDGEWWAHLDIEGPAWDGKDYLGHIGLRFKLDLMPDLASYERMRSGRAASRREG